MKITKHGQIPGEKVWVGRCQNCKSEAEATQAELTHITHDQREGSCSWEKCPVCEVGGKNGYGGMLFYPKDGK